MTAAKTTSGKDSQRPTEPAQRRSVAPKPRRRQVRLTVTHIYAESASPEMMQAVVDVLARLLDDRPAS